MNRRLMSFALAAVIVVGFNPKPAATSEPGSEPAAEPGADSGVELPCFGAGPQTPRDISNPAGLNPLTFALAPAAAELNLCNIHMHTNAEHKGPGFSVFVGATDHGGFACNETAALSEAEKQPMDGAFAGAKPGDTVEVHWVFSSCAVTPGEGLESCLEEDCTEPLLRVEAQTFLVVNNRNALDFDDFDYAGPGSGRHQPKALPSETGDPVVFRGSTTGPSYDQSTCSPLHVTWSVRPTCAKVDIASLHAWAAKGNVFNEVKSHGVRQLVTEPQLLAPIEVK